MQEVKRVVAEISGRRSKERYCILCYAVEIARRYQPQEPQMKSVCEEIRKEIGKQSNNTVLKALSRAVDDIWEQGDRVKLQEIYGRPLWERPSPKELVVMLAQYVWERCSDEWAEK